MIDRNIIYKRQGSAESLQFKNQHPYLFINKKNILTTNTHELYFGVQRIQKNNSKTHSQQSSPKNKSFQNQNSLTSRISNPYSLLYEQKQPSPYTKLGLQNIHRRIQMYKDRNYAKEAKLIEKNFQGQQTLQIKIDNNQMIQNHSYQFFVSQQSKNQVSKFTKMIEAPLINNLMRITKPSRQFKEQKSKLVVNVDLTIEKFLQEQNLYFNETPKDNFQRIGTSQGGTKNSRRYTINKNPQSPLTQIRKLQLNNIQNDFICVTGWDYSKLEFNDQLVSQNSFIISNTQNQ